MERAGYSTHRAFHVTFKRQSMRVECTQCKWLKNGMDCSAGKNVNHFGLCKTKRPKFDIDKVKCHDDGRTLFFKK